MPESGNGNTPPAQQPRSPSGISCELWTATLATLGVESSLLWMLLAGLLSPAGALALHGAMLVTLARWVRRTYRSEADLRYPLLLLATTAVLGPLGALGIVLTMVLVPWFARSAGEFAQWYADLFPETSVPLDLELINHIQSLGDITASTPNLVAFSDILSHGSREQKQTLLALVTNRFTPAFAPILKMALQDSNPSVRVQAATAMTKIENRFLQRTLELEQGAQCDPESPQAILALARHYDAYAFAGVMDEKRERENRDKAVAAYNRYLIREPEDQTARIELGRLLVRNGDFQAALDTLEVLVRDGAGSSQVAMWYLEGLYRLGRFQRLREFARSHESLISGESDLPPEAREVAKLWSQGDGPLHEIREGARV